MSWEHKPKAIPPEEPVRQLPSGYFTNTNVLRKTRLHCPHTAVEFLNQTQTFTLHESHQENSDAQTVVYNINIKKLEQIRK
jgi:hypothetical protein